MSETNKASDSFPIREPESLPAPSEFDCMCNADLRAVAISQSETIKAQGEEIERLKAEAKHWEDTCQGEWESHNETRAKLQQERDEAYERAAKVCDVPEEQWIEVEGDPESENVCHILTNCAATIRALKSEPTDEE